MSYRSASVRRFVESIKSVRLDLNPLDATLTRMEEECERTKELAVVYVSRVAFTSDICAYIIEKAEEEGMERSKHLAADTALQVRQ